MTTQKSLKSPPTQREPISDRSFIFKESNTDENYGEFIE